MSPSAAPNAEGPAGRSTTGVAVEEATTGVAFDRCTPSSAPSCGKDTEVPFQPRGDRPVYCSDCYNQRRGSFSGGGGSYRY